MLLVAGARPAARQALDLDALLTRYAAGDPVIATTFPTEDTFVAHRVELFTAVRDWRTTWNPTGVAFLLELSFWASEHRWQDGTVLFRTATELVTSRDRDPAASADADRFEITFHRAALAWLVGGVRSLAPAQAYLLDVVDKRVTAEPADARDGRLVDPRLLLARGILEEAWTSPGARVGLAAQKMPSFVLGDGDDELRAHLERALASFAGGADVPEIAFESAVRRAFSLYRLGRSAEALDLLGTPDEADADPVVRYWKQLVLGRVHEDLGHPDEAALAYQRALEIWPGAQTPAVALAVLFQRQGDAVRARQLARQAGSTSPTRLDPWWQYWSGDLRFVPAWLAQLRTGAS